MTTSVQGPLAAPARRSALLVPTVATATTALVAWAVLAAPVGPRLPTLILLPLAVVVAVVLATRDRDVLAPIVPLTAIVLLYYVGRPLFVLAEGRIGPTRAIEDRSLNPAILGYMGQASWLVLAAFVALACGYVFGTRLGGDGPAAVGARQPVRVVDPVRMGFVLGGTALLAIGVYGTLIAQAGGFGAYISALSVRSDYFFGRAYLTVATVPLKVALFVLIAMLGRGTRLSAPAKAGIGLIAALVLFGDFLTGGRSAVVLGTGLPLLLIVHYGYRRVRVLQIVAFVSLALVFFVAMRVLTRDAVYAGAVGDAKTSLLSAAFKDLPTTLVGGRDAIPYDSLERVIEGAEQGDAPQWGRTYLSILTYPVPRSVWPDKPLGGANTWFTRRYFPGYYNAGRVETSVSLAGESYANFREPGVLVAFALLGGVVGWGYRRARRTSRPLVLALYVLSFSYALTLIRGDAFHSVTSAATVVILAAAIYVVVGRTPSSREIAA